MEGDLGGDDFDLGQTGENGWGCCCFDLVVWWLTQVLKTLVVMLLQGLSHSYAVVACIMALTEFV